MTERADIHSDDYRPTIWRTCRVLANPHRLACLRVVIDSPASSVNEIATLTHLPPNKVSMHLRALQSRGLLHASRESRWVRYHPQPDPLVPSAYPILAAMRVALRLQRDPEVLRTLTAFTHPRRLTLLRCLQLSAPLPEETLSGTLRISPPALWRHLRKLASRHLVVRCDEGWRLHQRPSRLADTFLTLIALEPSSNAPAASP